MASSVVFFHSAWHVLNSLQLRREEQTCATVVNPPGTQKRTRATTAGASVHPLRCHTPLGFPQLGTQPARASSVSGCVCASSTPSGRSNAVNIAQRLGLDADVIAAARARLDDAVVAADEAARALEDLNAVREREELAAWAVEEQVADVKVRGCWS